MFFPDGWDQIPQWPGGWVLHQPTWGFGFDSQTRGTRENRAPPCVKVPGSSRVLLDGLVVGSFPWFLSTDVFYLFPQKQKRGAEFHIYLEEGMYQKRLFRGPNTNDIELKTPKQGATLC
jgi:hypothetical protein